MSFTSVRVLLAAIAAATVMFVSAGDATACDRLAPESLPPVITGSFGRAYVNRPYSHQLRVRSAAGQSGPYRFAAVGALPPGLTLNPDGLLHGTPAAYYNGLFDIRITDINNCVTTLAWFFRTVPESHIATAYLPVAIAGEAYPVQLEATGANSGYIAGNFPSSLRITVGGRIFGTAPAPGVYFAEVTLVAGQNAIDPREFGLFVNSPTCPSVSLEEGTILLPPVGSSFTKQIAVAGGLAPYTYSVGHGTTFSALLPHGMNLSREGILTGQVTDEIYIWPIHVRPAERAGNHWR